MNAWLVAAAVLLALGCPPCAWVVCRGAPLERVAGLNLAGTLSAVLFLLLARGYGRVDYRDLALVLAVTAPAGTLVFARFAGGPASDEGPADDGPRNRPA